MNKVVVGIVVAVLLLIGINSFVIVDGGYTGIGEYIEYLRVTRWNGELPKTLIGESDVLLSVSGD